MKTKKTKTTTTATKFVPTKFTKGLTPEKFELIFKIHDALLPHALESKELMDSFSAVKESFKKDPDKISADSFRAFLKTFYTVREGASATSIDIFFAFFAGAFLTYGMCDGQKTYEGLEAILTKSQDFWKMYSLNLPPELCEILTKHGIKAQIVSLPNQNTDTTDTTMKQSSDAATTPAVDKGLN